jgi:hypothetical protein
MLTELGARTGVKHIKMKIIRKREQGHIETVITDIKQFIDLNDWKTADQELDIPIYVLRSWYELLTRGLND